ncbi:acetyl esterase/lipase [Phyllobacterium sp. 1468]|uniref:alpha/beta hydrolase n=1 Tax=Phyllobacterium sp. 1468 TaxID=2817759 RepID=UPI00285A4AF9|nr:alpha/beta hydrolase [Phyllobacterium sp. 1468]MDR6632087.1 acetyl esterase/lipase [Phyllobacterium sp. 1468]
MRAFAAVTIVISTALGLAACSPARVLNFATSSNDAKVDRNIAYGKGPRRTLDVYAPRHAEGAPVAVFFYGGSWQSGDKLTYQFVASALAAKGIITIVPDYRLYPEVHYEGFLSDGAKAMAWAKDHALQYGGNPRRLFVAGHSAGAYIAAMLALDDAWLARESLSPGRDLKGFVGISGPYDIVPFTDRKIANIFSTAKTQGLSQPINFAGGRNPPALLLHGIGDKTVYPRNTTRLADKLRSMGSPVDVKLYSGVGHLGIIGAMGSPMRFVAPTLKDTTDFILGASTDE